MPVEVVPARVVRMGLADFIKLELVVMVVLADLAELALVAEFKLIVAVYLTVVYEVIVLPAGST
jgi:hypothetical protein